MLTEALSSVCVYREDFSSLKIYTGKAPRNVFGVGSFFFESYGLVVNLQLQNLRIHLSETYFG